MKLLTLARRALLIAGIAVAMFPAARAQVLGTPNGHIVGANGATFGIVAGGGGPSGPAYDPYPRTYVLIIAATSLLASGNTNAGVSFATVAAESNAVEVGFYLGMETSIGATAASLMSSWKTAAKANGITLRTFMYTPGMGPYYGSNATWLWLNCALADANMFAYNSSAGSGTTDLAIFNGYTEQGVLMLTPASAQTVPSNTCNSKTNVNAGLNVWNNYAQYYTDIYIVGNAVSKYGEANNGAANTYLDGIKLDNMYPGGYAVTTSATWNGWGTTPVANGTAVEAAVQQGDAKLFQAFQSLYPGMLIVANTAWSDRQPALDPSNSGLWNGYVFQEAEIGTSTSPETTNNSPPGAWMASMTAAAQTVGPTGALVLHQVGLPGGTSGLCGAESGFTSSEWQALRFGFAAAMMLNAAFSWNGCASYNNVGLLDEQVQGGNYGWLSNGTQRLDPPQTASWSNGIWRRRFPNGWVLWNPRGNGSQTVTVPSTLFYISTRGYGDSSVNTGLQVASGSNNVTLPDASGLFLIGTGMLLKPLAPAWQDAANDYFEQRRAA